MNPKTQRSTRYTPMRILVRIWGSNESHLVPISLSWSAVSSVEMLSPPQGSSSLAWSHSSRARGFDTIVTTDAHLRKPRL